MKVAGVAQRTIRVAADGAAVEIIDQTRLPFELRIARLESLEDAAEAIASMRVRGAPLIGVDRGLRRLPGAARGRFRRGARARLPGAARDAPHRREPRLGARARCAPRSRASAPGAARSRAPTRGRPRSPTPTSRPAARSASTARSLLAELAERRGGEPVNVLTHCNAGWLATVDWGTALAPVYVAFERGIPLHVWVSETRPRNQGASLTAWELAQHGVPHTVVADSAGGHLLQRGQRRPGASPAATAPPRPATSATRSGPIPRRSRRATTASRSTSRCRTRRSTGA